MKALTTFITLSLAFNILNASESLEEYISQNKKQQFEYDFSKNEADASKLRDSWIAPINLSYTYSKSKPNDLEQIAKTTSVSITQPIFASGGIYYGIKYAEAYRKYANYSVEVAKRKLTKDAIALLMQIKQIDLKKEKQLLSIKNAEINLEIKKEQYLNGQLDSSFLDAAIIERNSVKSALYDIEASKEKLISSFKAISDIDYKDAFVPHLLELEKNDFLNNNISLNMSKSEVSKNGYNKDVVVASYLARVSLTGGYNWYDTQLNNQPYIDDSYYNYGFKVTMPIDINSFRDVESSKLTYLKSQVAIDDKKWVLVSIYEQVMQNVENFQKKITLSQENKELYEKLLDDTKKLYEVGYKTKYDVETLSNSLAIQKLDVEILEFDKQLELLTLYETYKSE
ncbi:MAG: TolC family protein [Campylobacterales bacterium]|nr:TolC family protein [Campylobacterales bacterium]